MNEPAFNPNDPLFLLSRSLDEQLSTDESARLDKAMREGEVSADELKGLRAMDRLVRKWGAQAPAEDQEFVGAVVAGIRTDSGKTKERTLDDLLERWGQSEPSLDWNRFHTAVMRKVAGARRQSQVHRLLFRIGTPLAAAAVIGLAVIAMFRQPTALPPQLVREPRSVVMLYRHDPAQAPRLDSQEAAQVTVSFSRVLDGPECVMENSPDIGSGWVGVASADDPTEEMPPL